MTIQDTSRVAGVARGDAKPAPAKTPRPIRRLPVQKDWPSWAIVAVQIGILVGIIALWEIGARAGLIDGFFWSQPSAIWRTFIIFFTEGDAWTDIGFTFRSTFSLWDTFRALHPWLNLTQPRRDADMARSMLAHYDQSAEHMLPVWSHHANENWCMSGYHSVSVLADAALTGATVYRCKDGLVCDGSTRTGGNGVQLGGSCFLSEECGGDAFCKEGKCVPAVVDDQHGFLSGLALHRGFFAAFVFGCRFVVVFAFFAGDAVFGSAVADPAAPVISLQDVGVRFSRHVLRTETAALAAAAAEAANAPSDYSSASESRGTGSNAPASTGGSLASDEQLAALREKLSGNA